VVESEKQENELITPDEAVARLERYCAYQDRYKLEIVQKMREYQLEPAIAETILNYLIEEKFIDDARYADAFVRGKVRQNHWGLVKVQQALRAKGIDHCHVQAAMENLPKAEYQEILASELKKRWKVARAATPILRRQKAVQAVIRAGFEPDLVFEAAHRLL
jgi:regulatory protein